MIGGVQSETSEHQLEEPGALACPAAAITTPTIPAATANSRSPHRFDGPPGTIGNGGKPPHADAARHAEQRARRREPLQDRAPPMRPAAHRPPQGSACLPGRHLSGAGADALRCLCRLPPSLLLTHSPRSANSGEITMHALSLSTPCGSQGRSCQRQPARPAPAQPELRPPSRRHGRRRYRADTLSAAHGHRER